MRQHTKINTKYNARARTITAHTLSHASPGFMALVHGREGHEQGLLACTNATSNTSPSTLNEGQNKISGNERVYLTADLGLISITGGKGKPLSLTKHTTCVIGVTPLVWRWRKQQRRGFPSKSIHCPRGKCILPQMQYSLVHRTQRTRG